MSETGPIISESKERIAEKNKEVAKDFAFRLVMISQSEKEAREMLVNLKDPKKMVNMYLSRDKLERNLLKNFSRQGLDQLLQKYIGKNAESVLFEERKDGSISVTLKNVPGIHFEIDNAKIYEGKNSTFRGAISRSWNDPEVTIVWLFNKGSSGFRVGKLI